VSEGFGLPPIEALACGCVVFSSLNHALADLLDPGLLGHQIGCGTLEADVERITAAATDPDLWQPKPECLTALLNLRSEVELLQRWQHALTEINLHWNRLTAGAVPLSGVSAQQLHLRQQVQALIGKVWRSAN